MNYELFDLETAPPASKPLLEQSLKSFGMIPNLHAVLAASPPTLEAYQILHGLFQKTSFNAEELTVVWQTINVEHECHYCVPAHTGISRMMKVDEAINDALRNRSELPNKKLQSLHVTTLALVRDRGRISEAQQAEFFAAGYERHHLLEIVLGLSQKVISNYANHLADTPVDGAFEKFAWAA
jgi:alkylhydroperoxidase family enzyme